MKKFTHLTRISLLLFIFFGLDKCLGIFRQVFIARRFLIPDQDAFNVANNVPDLLSALISGGALAMAFTPILSALLTKEGRDSAWEIFSRIANLAFVITGTLSLVIAISANWLVGWKFGIAPGLPLDQQHLVAELMRLNLVATMIFSISGLCMAGLQANQHFLLPALAPIFYNLGQIFGLVILAPSDWLALRADHTASFRIGGAWPCVWGDRWGAAAPADPGSRVDPLPVQMDSRHRPAKSHDSPVAQPAGTPGDHHVVHPAYFRGP